MNLPVLLVIATHMAGWYGHTNSWLFSVLDVPAAF
jgi:hypothetical protein